MATRFLWYILISYQRLLKHLSTYLDLKVITHNFQYEPK
jgi:hypothetical protein